MGHPDSNDNCPLFRLPARDRPEIPQHQSPHLLLPIGSVVRLRNILFSAERPLISLTSIEYILSITDMDDVKGKWRVE